MGNELVGVAVLLALLGLAIAINLHARRVTPAHEYYAHELASHDDSESPEEMGE